MSWKKKGREMEIVWCRGDRMSFFEWVFRERLTTEVHSCKYQMKWETELWERWKKIALGRGNSKCKDPEVVCVRETVKCDWGGVSRGRAGEESEIMCKDSGFSLCEIVNTGGFGAKNCQCLTGIVRGEPWMLSWVKTAKEQEEMGEEAIAIVQTTDLSGSDQYGSFEYKHEIITWMKINRVISG